MEAAAAVTPTPIPAPVKAETPKPKSAGIGKGNIEFLTHHIGQARQSLDRALERGHLMTKDKTGTYATRVKDDLFVLEDAISDFGKVTDRLNGVLSDIQEDLG